MSRFARWARALRSWWQPILLVCMLAVPNLTLLPYYVAHDGSLYALAQLGMACLLLSLLLLCLPVRYWFLAGGLLLLLFPLELVSLLSIAEPLNFGIYWSIRSTTTPEAIGQLRAYVVPVVVYLLALLLYALVLAHWWSRGLRTGWIPRRHRKRLGFTLILLLLLLPMLAISGQGYLSGPKQFLLHHYAPRFKALLNGSFPIDILRHTLAYSKAQRAMGQIVRERKRMDDQGELTDTTRLVGIFVLGETSRACNWQLGGYERDTNPRLAARDGLFYFTNAYSGANYTQLAAPMLVSCATPFDHDRWLTTPFITEALRSAGYRTGWITQQSGQEVWATLALAGCTYTHIVDTHFPEPIRHDEKLIPFALRFFESGGERDFLVMHTYGGHYYYPDRYPADRACYLPELPRGIISAKRCGREQRDVLLNSFDNTIRYTDSVLDVLISTLERDPRPSFLVYVPDHGENIFDNEEIEMLHATRNPSHWEQHVPVVVWLSPSYRLRYPERAASLGAHRNLPIQTTSTFHTLLHLANVHCPVGMPARSLASPTFTPVTDRSVLGPFRDIEPEPLIPEQGPCAHAR